MDTSLKISYFVFEFLFNGFLFQGSKSRLARQFERDPNELFEGGAKTSSDDLNAAQKISRICIFFYNFLLRLYYFPRSDV